MSDELKRLRAAALQSRLVGEFAEADELAGLAKAIEIGPRDSAVMMARIEAVGDPELRVALADLWETMNRESRRAGLKPAPTEPEQDG